MKMNYFLLPVLGVLTAAPAISAQQIRITIPRRSEMTLVQRLNREGVDEVVKHKYEKAEALFYKAYLNDPSDPFTLNNLGYVAELQGQIDRAANYYKLAVEQGCEAVIDRSSNKKLKGKPMMDALGTVDNMPMRVNRINIYAIQLIMQNRGFEAEAVLKQALALDPQNPFTLNNLAIAEQSVGDLQSALKNYDAAASTRSKQPVVVSLQKSSRGKAISEVASASAAKLRLKMADMNPQQIEAYMYAVRGVSALNNNDLAEAKKNFEASYQADPESAFSLNNLGYLAEVNGDLETAVSFYARAQRADDANTLVGASSSADAYHQHIASVATHSRKDVYQELKDTIPTPQDDENAPDLLRRDDVAARPADNNPQVAADTKVASEATLTASR